MSDKLWMMKLLNKWPLIIGLFFIWFYFHSNNNKVNYQVQQQVYQVKEDSIFDGDTLRVISSDNQELALVPLARAVLIHTL